MAIQVLRPGIDNYIIGVTIVGGSGPAYDTLDDAVVDDTSYLTAAANTQWPSVDARVYPVTGSLSAALTGGPNVSNRILRTRFRVRTRLDAAATAPPATIALAERTQSGQYDQWENFSSRSTTVAEQSGVWRAKPPSGLGLTEWTAYSLEHCQADIKWYRAGGNGVNLRLTELYWDVDIRARATISAVTVTGTTTSTSPTVGWTFVPNADGDPQVAWRAKVFSSAQYTAASFNADTSASIWDSGQTVGNANTVTVGTSLLSGATYRAYAISSIDFNGSKWWTTWTASSPFTISLIPLQAPTMVSVTSDNTPPFIRNRIAVQANWNLLTAQDASFEAAGVGSWASLFGGGTLARVTTQFANGIASMSMTKVTAIGDHEALTGGGATGFKVKVGQSYTALASFKTAVTARSCSVGIAWYDRTGAPISNAYGTAITDATTGWTQASYTATAPALSVYGSVWVKAAACAISEVHYVDKVSCGTNVVIGTGTTSGSTGVTVPVVAAKYDFGYWDSPSKAKLCVGIPAGSLLVAVTASGVSASIPSNVVTTSGLTWTNRQENTLANSGDVSISTAYDAAGGDRTITVTANQADARTIVYAITGHDEVTFGGASAKAQTAGTGAPSVSLTTARENSLVIGAVGDFNEVNGNSRVYRVPGGAATEDFYGDFGDGVTYFWHSTRATAGAANEGLTNPSTMAYGIAAIEIRGATGTSSVTTSTGWTPGGYVGTASTVVERALVGTGPRNNAHPQLWSGGDWFGTADGFFLAANESTVAYDPTDRYDGEGSVVWGVNNGGSKLYFGWPSAPAEDASPSYAMPCLPGTAYTFGVYAKASVSFSSQLNMQALDQFGTPVGSPTSSGAISITTGWAQYSATITAPAGAVYVRAHLDNTASVVEQRVWVDGVQWVTGALDTKPGFGTGQAVSWKTVRGAEPGNLLLADGATALVGGVSDAEAPPGYVILYRAYNYISATDTVPALASGVTTYIPAQLTPPGRGVWVLRDPLDASLALRAHVIGMTETQHEESQTVYPLRPTTWDQLGQRALTTTDFIGGLDGTLQIVCDTESEWLLLRRLVGLPRPLWLIFPDFGARYIRITDRSWPRETPRTDQGTDSIFRRTVSLTFMEAEAP